MNKPTWRKARRSMTQGGDCVELAVLPGNIGVRDSKNPTGSILTFDQAQFGRFLGRIKRDEI